MKTLNEKEFLQLTKKGNLIPVYQEILGDLDTPVSVYFKLARQARYSFLLESVEGEEKVARYSFLAKDPQKIVIVKNGRFEIHEIRKTSRKVHRVMTSKPLEEIRKLMAAYRCVSIPGLPRFFGGLVGYIGYDMVRYFERLPRKPKDDLKLPDAVLMLAKEIIIFDHRHHKIQVVNCVHITDGMSQKQKLNAYRSARKQIQTLVSQIRKPFTEPASTRLAQSQKCALRSNLTQSEFHRMVNQAKKEIQRGEIIQVVLSQRFALRFGIEPFQIYRMLRHLNPSPYMYFLKLDDLQIAGASPELLVRCEEGLVETRPIAGTRWRGKDAAEDERLAKELLADPKEKAEHIMLVDLGRNDLGRVCEQGTVKVDEFMAIEKYSHVMHIVSNVRGKLRRGKDALDVLEATFPAGTVSGAPKIRAMEIIDGLENVSRGPYAGCIGYFSFSGNLDTCITIRTIVVHKKTAYIQAGCGIVADSNPQREYTETLNKAKAQLLALEAASRPGI